MSKNGKRNAIEKAKWMNERWELVNHVVEKIKYYNFFEFRNKTKKHFIKNKNPSGCVNFYYNSVCMLLTKCYTMCVSYAWILCVTYAYEYRCSYFHSVYALNIPYSKYYYENMFKLN